jgi:hypothetical protein
MDSNQSCKQEGIEILKVMIKPVEAEQSITMSPGDVVASNQHLKQQWVLFSGTSPRECAAHQLGVLGNQVV